MPRKPLHGTRQILAFNWPFYAVALSAIGAGIWALRARRWPRVLEWGGALGLAAGAWWSVASVAVSWWVYDASPLYKWEWLRAYFAGNPRDWAIFHAGVDDATPLLRELFESEGAAYDFFDASVMTEPSIGRARAVSLPEIAPVAIDFRAFPLESESLDAAFVMLAAHELREAAQREQFFGELARVLRPNGTLVVAEHTRSAANFAAFGPGALHFFAAQEWRRLGAREFKETHEFGITPFVRAWVWRKMGDQMGQISSVA